MNCIELLQSFRQKLFIQYIGNDPHYNTTYFYDVFNCADTLPTNCPFMTILQNSRSWNVVSTDNNRIHESNMCYNSVRLCFIVFHYACLQLQISIGRNCSTL